MKGLGRRFYGINALELAPNLLGRILFHDSPEGLTTGRIVEVEAYRGTSDPGSHASRGMTKRNQVMFGPPGHLYVYFTYGMHWCSNIVCEPEGVAGAVLLRAVEPLEGVEIMAKRRGTEERRDLARGPARLTQAFGIDGELNGVDLAGGVVGVYGRGSIRGGINRSSRIGLTSGASKKWRFYEKGVWASRP